MDQHLFSSSNWLRALTLAERIAVFSTNGQLQLPKDLDRKIARNQLLKWRSQPQFETDELLERRLAFEGINQDELALLLAAPITDLAISSDNLEWVQALTEGYSRPASYYANPPPGAEELCFLDLIQPLIDQACDQLFLGIENILSHAADLPFEPREIEDILLMNLPEPLLIRLGRTMVLELNIARLQGVLSGVEPSERFQSFIERIRRPEYAVAILSDYPVLARQITVCLNQWVNVSLEFIERLCRDWQRIVQLFCNGQDPGRLIEVAGGAGDTHRGGRSVMIAEFESGFRLVYKPKSLAVDIHFQQLLTWLNEKGSRPPFRALSILDKVDYGWVEYIAHEQCTTAAEINRYYRRLGAYLALLYAINASDFHLENLIACGEHPLLIDLETLFNPDFEPFDESDAASSAAKAMLNSVLVVGMLPQRLWSQDEYAGVDISGLGGESGQLSPDRVPQPEAPGTDEMRYVRDRLEMAGEANRPLLNGAEATAIDHIPDIIDGFESMYDLLLNHRQRLLASYGPLARFGDDETRVLLRPTRTYDQLLFESFHPDVLADALPRDLHFDRLWLVVPSRAYMAKAIPAEQHDLHQGDIPVFTTTPASRILWSAAGEPIHELLLEDGLSIARRRIDTLCHTDLDRQKWFIRASLATLTPHEFGLTTPMESNFQPAPASTATSHPDCLDTARSIAGELVTTAVHGQDDVTWIGLEHLGDGIWDLAPAGADFYNGIAGISFFLAYAGSILKNEDCTALARKSVNGLLRHIELYRTILPEIGACTGWAGVLYTLTHLAVLWEDNQLASQAGDLVQTIAGFVAQDENYTISDGAAGAILALLGCDHSLSTPLALETAIACGDHLLSSSQVQENGLAWSNPNRDPQPLLGYAHGAAGIAVALLQLSETSDLTRFKDAAQQAIAYERSLFSPAEHNWPDLRHVQPGENPQRYPVAWCHGAAGIGLARLQTIEFYNDQYLYEEIHSALRTTTDRGFGQNHSLCHGDMGLLDFLLVADQSLPRKNSEVALHQYTQNTLYNINLEGWLCGGPLAVNIPGLMIGLSGIGYQLLRLSHPTDLPSILMFDAPPC